MRCRDQRGRQFIVEMQMMWTSAYRQRVLFNASKAYVSQLPKGGDYELLQPVYSLNLVNDTFAEGADYYHDFRIVEEAETKPSSKGCGSCSSSFQVYPKTLQREADAGAVAALPHGN